MGRLTTRLDRLEGRLPEQAAAPDSDRYLWLALNDAPSLDLFDQHLAAVAAGDLVRAVELQAAIDARLEAIAACRVNEHKGLR